MHSWQLIAFIVFFACSAGQFWVVGRVRNALIDRHADKYLEIERSSVFPQRGLQKFIRSNQHREMGDPALSKAVREWRYLFGLAICSFLVFAAGMFFPLQV